MQKNNRPTWQTTILLIYFLKKSYLFLSLAILNNSFLSILFLLQFSASFLQRKEFILMV